MRSKPLFYKQETLYSCVPACLRIVLSGFGHEYSEAEIRTLCDCTPFGTEALMVVDAARRFGFRKSVKHTISINELQDLIAIGKYPGTPLLTSGRGGKYSNKSDQRAGCKYYDRLSQPVIYFVVGGFGLPGITINV